jgi:O-antigen/teichoic acid export membrane protein
MSARFVFGSTATYLAVSIATSATSVLLVPLMTRALTPADYGVMLLIANGSAVIGYLFAFPFAQAVPTLFNAMSDDRPRRALTTTIFLSIATIMLLPHALVGMLSTQISIIFTNIPNYADAIAWSALWSYLNICSLILILIARTTERHSLYLLVQLPALALQTVLIVWFVVLHPMRLVGFYLATAITATVIAAAYLLALRRWITGSFEAQFVSAACRIGAQTLPWQLAVVLTTSSAAFFLTWKGHLNEAGLFSLASGIAGVLMAISNSFESVWSPFVLMRRDQPDLAKVQIRMFSLFSSALLIVASAISLFAHEIFMFLTGPAFQEGYRLVPALSLALCILAFANCFAQGFQARQRTVHYAWIGLVVIMVFFAACLGLVGRFGAFGIIASMGAAFLTMLILLQLMSRRFMPVPYTWGRHGLMWLTAVAIVAYGYPLEVSLVGIAAKTAAIVCISCLPFLFGVVHLHDARLAYDTVFRAIS